MVEIHNGRWNDYLKGPGGKTLSDNFPVPSDVYTGDVCTATGNQATDGYESNDEVLIRGAGPYLPCDQLSAYQQSELDHALDTLNQGPYTGGAVDSIYRYRSAAEGSGDYVQQIEPVDGDGNINEDFTEDEEPPIEPLN